MRTVEKALALASRGRLYPSVILYGGDAAGRQQTALDFARTLLCAAADEASRGCDAEAPDACRHCRRIRWRDRGQDRFHPDFRVLERDLRTATSVEATKAFLQTAWSAPFEAAAQVFVIAEADTLSGGAADALLKLLEEPPARTPRHFLLLAASQLDLLPTLRSRSLALFLGQKEQLPQEEVEAVAAALARSLDVHFQTPSPIFLFGAAAALGEATGWDDPRARRPWAVGSAAVLRYLAAGGELTTERRRALLRLAQELLDGPLLRMRGISHGRILEGLVCRFIPPDSFRP
ncbi:MAG: hypothetical protein MPN21_08565 [Thermoanaerobaculia bacterium]|nr:hypothetical protein [Thermoanaerobaculia bacterium]